VTALGHPMRVLVTGAGGPGVPSPRFDILEKPFTEAALLSRVRQAINEAAPRA